MEFISTEEFLKQDEKVQKEFIDWWKPQLLDLYIFDKRIIEIVRTSDENMILPCKSNNIWEEKKHCIPLLTEGQLREFIENKTNKTLFIDFDCIEEKLDYDIYLFDNNDKYIKHENLGNSLFKAYWKVALEIAKESVENEYK